MDKIALKRLKRRRKLAGRVKCHGSVIRCSAEHADRGKSKLNVKPRPRVIEAKGKKPSILKRIGNIFKPQL